jgi:dihydrodipicolinate synthase/N-acetylneuraminate lyase
VTNPTRGLEGVIPILSMPFRDYAAIDRDDLVAETDFSIDAGVDGVGLGFGS